MERMPLYVLKDCNTTGIDKVPEKSIMLNRQTGGLFNLTNRTGLINTLKFKDFTGKFFSMEPADFTDTCPPTPPFTVTVPTEIFIMYKFPHAVLPDYPLDPLTINGISGYRIYGTNKIGHPTNPYQVVNSNGSIYTASTIIAAGVVAMLYPDGTWVETVGGIDNEKQDLIDQFANDYIGRFWDRTGE